MLRGTALRARKVAPASYLIEPAPRVAQNPPRRPPPQSTRPRPAPPPVAVPPPQEIVVTATKRDIPLGAYPGGFQRIDGVVI